MCRCFIVVSQSQVEDVQWCCAVSWQNRSSPEHKRKFKHRTTNRSGVKRQQKASVLMSYMTVILWEMDHDSVILFPWARPWWQSSSGLPEQVMMCCGVLRTLTAPMQ